MGICSVGLGSWLVSESEGVCFRIIDDWVLVTPSFFADLSDLSDGVVVCRRCREDEIWLGSVRPTWCAVSSNLSTYTDMGWKFSISTFARISESNTASAFALLTVTEPPWPSIENLGDSTTYELFRTRVTAASLC